MRLKVRVRVRDKPQFAHHGRVLSHHADLRLEIRLGLGLEGEKGEVDGEH